MRVLRARALDVRRTGVVSIDGFRFGVRPADRRNLSDPDKGSVAKVETCPKQLTGRLEDDPVDGRRLAAQTNKVNDTPHGSDECSPSFHSGGDR